MSRICNANATKSTKGLAGFNNILRSGNKQKRVSLDTPLRNRAKRKDMFVDKSSSSSSFSFFAQSELSSCRNQRLRRREHTHDVCPFLVSKRLIACRRRGLRRGREGLRGFCFLDNPSLRESYFQGRTLGGVIQGVGRGAGSSVSA